MAIARRVDGLSAFTGSDMKFVFYMEGVDQTGKTGTFRVSTAPEAAAVLTGTVSLLDVAESGDGVPTSILQAFAAKSAVVAAKAGLSLADPGADVTLYYEFRVSGVGDEIGTNAETTLMYGNFIIKGSI